MEQRSWQPALSSSQRDVSYSCGACGFSLNLCSSDRLVTQSSSSRSKLLLGGRSRRRESLAFVKIDNSRFEFDEASNCCWIHPQKSRFLCKKCGAYVGYMRRKHSSSSSSASSCERFYLKIRALNPEEFRPF